MAYFRYTTATPSSPLSTASGTAANINDNNTGTTHEVIGINPTYFWFIMDLGTSQPVNKAELMQWYETGSGDTGFQIRYSDSALNSGNTGTQYGSDMTATASPTKQDNSQTPGEITARYWGLYRTGNFVGQNVGVADFNLYGPNDLNPSGFITII